MKGNGGAGCLPAEFSIPELVLNLTALPLDGIQFPDAGRDATVCHHQAASDFPVLLDKMSLGGCLVLGWLVFQAVGLQSRFASENIIKCWRVICPLLEESA